MTAFDAIDVIRAKRDGVVLTPEQIRWVIGAYTAGAVPDEQMSALLMAVFFRGMTPDELAVWTQAMIDSGERQDLSSLGRPTADKPTLVRMHTLSIFADIYGEESDRGELLLRRKLLALRCDDDADLGDHVREHLERNRVAADALDRLHLELAAVDAELLLIPEPVALAAAVEQRSYSYHSRVRSVLYVTYTSGNRSLKSSAALSSFAGLT